MNKELENLLSCCNVIIKEWDKLYVVQDYRVENLRRALIEFQKRLTQLSDDRGTADVPGGETMSKAEMLAYSQAGDEMQKKWIVNSTNKEKVPYALYYGFKDGWDAARKYFAKQGFEGFM